LIDIFKNSCIVLSPARTGSQLIAGLLADRYYDGQDFVRDPDCRSTLQSRKRFIGHSHELFDAVTLGLFVPVFSIRESIVDSVVSRVIANHFRIWEPSHLTLAERTSTAFLADMRAVARALDQQRDWYCHYVTLLDSSSHVVSYEVLTSCLANNRPEYINKQRVVKNYSEILHYVQDNIDQDLRRAHGEFVDWKCRPNRQAIYQLLQS
jgi:hypothetical protein